MMLEIKNVSITYKSGRTLYPVIKNMTAECPEGFTVILGPNGAGKSTLMKAVFGIIPYTGQIMLNKEDLKPLPVEDKTKLISYLPQMDISSSNLTVLEMVLLGRIPDLGHRVKDEDLQTVVAVLRRLGIEKLSKRPFTQLSGGQQKMILIAQTLVRSPSLILLDEPVNSLDMQKQLELCDVLKEITVKDNISIVAILHDINLAARFADYLIVLDRQGSVYAHGKPHDVITAKMLEDVYGVLGDVIVGEAQVPHIVAQQSVNNNKDAFFTEENGT